MREKNIEIKVGLLVLVAAALFVGFVFMLGDFQTGSRREILVDFPTSADLKTGAPVKVSGVSIGKVDRVEFWGGRIDPALQRRVQIRVALDVDAQMAEAIRDDAIPYISTLGILGEKYVEIEPGTIERPALAANAVLVGEPPLRLELVARDLSGVLNELSGLLRENRDKIGSILDNLDRVLVDVDRLVVENREAVAALLASLRASAGQLERVLAAAEVGVGDGSEIRQTLEHVLNTARQVDGSVGPITRRVDATLVSVQGAAGSIQAIGDENRDRIVTLLDRIVEVVGDVKFVAKAIRDGRGSVGALLADQELYTRIKETIADLQRHPWKFIWKE